MEWLMEGGERGVMVVCLLWILLVGSVDGSLGDVVDGLARLLLRRIGIAVWKSTRCRFALYMHGWIGSSMIKSFEESMNGIENQNHTHIKVPLCSCAVLS